MKKKLIVLISFVISVFSSYNVYCKQQSDIAIISIEKIFEDTNSIKTEREKLENEKKAIENSIREKERMLQEEQEDIESKASILSQTKIQQKREEFQKKVIEFQREANEKGSKLQARVSNIQEKLMKEISKVLETNKYKDYSVVLNSAVIIHNNTAVDITNEVIKDLNKKKISLE